MTHVFGACLCGAVRFRLDGTLREVIACRCGQCRRFHGHYAAYTALPADRLAFLGDGRPAWYRSSDIAERGFCAGCGSSLFWRRVGGGWISVAAGALDEGEAAAAGLRLAGHIFVPDKGPYYEVADGLPRHEAGLDSPLLP